MPAATITARDTALPTTQDALRGPVHMSEAASTPTTRVRIARELKGLTQAQLAERVGCHLETVKAWDRGKHKPGSPEAAQQLADVLEQPLEWLFPPEQHIYIAGARARYPTPSAKPHTGSPTIPEPQNVLATLHRTRPGLRRRARWLAPVIALTTAAVGAAAVVLATTGDEQPAARPGSARAPRGVAPVLAAAPPPLLAARAVNTTDRQQRLSTHRRKPRAHTSRRHHRSAPSQRRATQSDGGSSPAAPSRTAQPASTTRQAAATTATASAATPASSTPPKRQPADTPSSGGGEFLP